MKRKVTCGVIITDGHSLLLGHASGSARWDIPKGIAEPGEAFIDAAIRELAEETGLKIEASKLTGVGVHPYLRNKDLAVFAWRPVEMPEPSLLSCNSFIDRRGIPELDRFGIFALETALGMIGKNLARVVQDVWPSIVVLTGGG